MNSCCKTCFHCKGELPADPIKMEVDGATIKVCSDTCAQTVSGIVKSGLTDFYTHREAPVGAQEQSPLVEDWATYERPAVMREFVRSTPSGDNIADLLVQGVHCAACTWLIENTLSKISGVTSIEVNPVTTRGELRWNPEKVQLSYLLEAISKIGYTPVPFTEQQTQHAAEQEKHLAMRRLLVAGLGMMQVTSFAIAMYAGAFQGMDPNIQEFFRLISLVVATPVVWYSGAPFFSGAWRSLRTRRLGMDVPVALAVGAAWSASVWNTFSGSGEVFFDSATMFVFFLSGTRYLEAAGRHRAFDLTHALAQHIPCTAIRLTTDGHEEVGVMELEQDDQVLVAQGVAFPADGILLDELAHIDEAMLTGESGPVTRRAGDAVVAGTINAGDAVKLRVEKTGADTVLAQIGRLVTQAGSERPPLVQLTDRVASIFVSAVLLIALVTGFAWWQIDPTRAFEIVLTVLVVTCPCALALATPAALTVATSTLARNGFLIRRGGALPSLANIQQVLFDKTGTLTENSLVIDRIETTSDWSADQAIAIAAALEANSAHPIARAFRGYQQMHPAERLRSVDGGGLEGWVNGELFRIGTQEFAAGQTASAAAEITTANPQNRTVYLANDAGIVAFFEIAERLRDGAAHTIRALQAQNISVTIASGDQAAPVAALAKSAGADHWQAQMLPQAKLKLVRDLQTTGARVAAVGDGINDSPLLAGADVSIAMGSGTSIAQHSADCIWMGNQLTGLETAFTTAKRTMQIVRQNLLWALCYNLSAIPLAAGGFIAPWMAALGMSLSSLMVMLNALRLSRTEKLPEIQQKATDCSASKATPEPVS